MGLVDEVVHHSKLHRAAKTLVTKMNSGKFQRKPIKKSLVEKLLDSSLGRGVVFSQARKKTLKATKGNYPAPIAIIECVEAGLKKGLKNGYEKEVVLFEELMLSDVSKALRNLFFTTTEKKKNPYNVKPKNTDRIAVLGAGFMGGGITDVSVNNGMDVILKDLSEDMIQSSKSTIWKGLKRKLKRKQLKDTEAKTIVQRAVGQTDFKGVSGSRCCN